MPSDVAVSVVVPARNEAGYLGRTLCHLDAQETDIPYEIIVVDGASADATPEIARDAPGVQLVRGPADGIARGRNRGAHQASGRWLAFVDADTCVVPSYLQAMHRFVSERDLLAASSRCHIPGYRTTLMAAVINHVFPRLRYPILPGFNFWIARDTFEHLGGFPDVPNEDTAFSRRIARHGPVAYHPETLVETSGRRIRRTGLSGTAYHYLRLDVARIRAQRRSENYLDVPD